MRVGRLGGRQEVSLIKTKGCLRKFNVMHELMHTLGFWHEQQREDRDQYITVNYSNIISGKWNTWTLKVIFSKTNLHIQQIIERFRSPNTTWAMDSIKFNIWTHLMTTVNSVHVQFNEMTFNHIYWHIHVDSIMHYHAYSFAINPNVPTMVPKDGCSKIGNELIFSKVKTF